MKKIIERYRFDGIWHFTDRSNIKLIAKHGLLSLAELEQREIAIPVPGGNDWSHDADKRRGLHEYVHLAFVDDHPMLFIAKNEGRIKTPVWLKIDSSIILDDNVRFCSDVSNKRGVSVLNAQEAMKEIDFEVLFTYMNWRDPAIMKRRTAAIKSEILIPKCVPVKKILTIKNG